MGGGWWKYWRATGMRLSRCGRYRLPRCAALRTTPTTHHLHEPPLFHQQKAESGQTDHGI